MVCNWERIGCYFVTSVLLFETSSHRWRCETIFEERVRKWIGKSLIWNFLLFEKWINLSPFKEVVISWLLNIFLPCCIFKVIFDYFMFGLSNVVILFFVNFWLRCHMFAGLSMFKIYMILIFARFVFLRHSSTVVSCVVINFYNKREMLV